MGSSIAIKHPLAIVKGDNVLDAEHKLLIVDIKSK